MNISEWRWGLAHRGALPADLDDAIRMYPEVASICCKRHCYGMLLLFLALKMPTARNVFLQCWKHQNYESSVEKVFAALSKFASSMDGRSVEEETREIGGPLYAHGWQVLLRQLHVIGCSGRGRVLIVGSSEKAVRLQKISDQATRSIRSWLDLHVSVFAVIKLGPPSTVEEWGFRACILYESFQFHQVPGMLVGAESYSCQWLVRTFMVCFMRSENVPRLNVAWFDKVSDLNGPDQGGHVQRIAEQCETPCILGLMRALAYDGPAELLTMYLCLIPTRLGGVNKKKRSYSDLVGDCFLHAGRMFQTRTSFLRDTCGITSTRQPAYDKIQNARFDAEDTIVFCRISKFRISSLRSDVRKGAVDVVTTGLAVLCSSLDEPGKASLDGDALYAYDVDALRALYEETKARKK